MKTRRAVIAAAAILVAGCLSDRVVTPSDPLPAVIAVDKPGIQFVKFALGRQVAEDTIRVTNNGQAELGIVSIDPTVQYAASSRTGWITTTVIDRPGDSAWVVIRPTYQPAAGGVPDTARLLIRATGAEQSRFVQVVARTLPGARFEFSTNPVTFATVPGGPSTLTQVFSTRNGGNGDLPIRQPRIRYLGASTDWLDVAPEPGGSATAPSYSLAAHPDALPSGLHEAWVVFESPEADPVRAAADSFPAQLRIGAPRLAASTGLVGFVAIRGGSAPAPEVVTLSNNGEGTFGSLGVLRVDPIGYPSGPTGWLDASLVNGIVTLVANSAGLPQGTFTATVPLASQHGGSVLLSATIEVRLPGLTLSSRTVSFNAVERGTGPAPRLISISNSGSGTLATLGALSLGAVRFGAGSPTGWLTASLLDSTVTLTPTLGSLAAGIYNAAVGIVSQNGGSDSVFATFTVARASDPPTLSVSTDAVGFSGIRGDPNPPPQTVFLSNSGGGTLGTIGVGTVSAPWLTATIVGGNLELRAATGALPAGTETATVSVTAQNAPGATVTVTFSVSLPTLSLSATSAAFSATVGGSASPVSRSITATNSGAGSVSTLGALAIGAIGYGAGQPTGWLAATATGATITLTATTGSLPTDLYIATVPVVSPNGGTVPITVTFTVAPPAIQPSLAVNPGGVSFAAIEGGSSPATKSITVYNSGGGIDADLGTISATIPGAASWLSRTIGAGSIVFSATTGSLAPGSYATTVTVGSAAGGSVDVPVSFSVAPAGLDPRLSVATRSLGLATVEGNPTLGTRTIAFINLGGGTLGTVTVGSVSYSGTSTGWLTPSIVGNSIVITPATGGLPGGASTATFPVSTTPAIAGSPITITIGLTVADTADSTVATRLSLSSRQLSFSADSGAADPANQFIDVGNSGGGLLGVVALGATSYSGAATGWLTKTYSVVTDRITLAVNSSGLDPGVSTATFPVSTTPTASGSPALVTVRLTVEGVGADPELALSSTAVTFAATQGANPAGSQTIAIRNVGGGTLGNPTLGVIGYGSGASGWLTRGLTASTLTLSATTLSLAPGTYTAAFTVTASGTSETVRVVAAVAPDQEPPRLTLSSRSLSFSTVTAGAVAPQTVTATNTGGGNLTSLGAVSVGTIAFGAGANGWLAASVNGSTGTITVTPSIGALGSGSYGATIPVNSTLGGSSAINVALTIAADNAPPSLQLSVSSLTFGATLGATPPAPQTITITNAGGGSLAGVAVGTIAFTPGQPTQWLAVPATGSPITGSTLGFSVDPTGLTAGAYSATVPIISSNGGTKNVGVTLTVEAPILTLSTRTVSFDATQGTVPPATQTVALRNTGIGTFANLGAIALGPVTYGTQEPFAWLTAGIRGETIELSATINDLPQGTFTARLPVISQFGGTVTLVVTYTVAPGAAPPVLAVSSRLVLFNGTLAGANPPAQTISVSNLGGQTLGALSIGSIAPTADWLTVTLTGNQVRIAVALTGLPAGNLETAVPIVSANAGTETVVVSLEIGAPKLALSVTTVTFGDTVASARTLGADVFLTNGGAGDLAALGSLRVGAIRYRSGEPSGWLTNPAAPVALANPIVSLKAGVSTLAAGQYHADVDVESEHGGNGTIAVTMAVNQPDPSFDRPSIDFALNGISVDTVTKSVAVGDTTQSAIRLQIRNPNETAIGLSGLRVAAPVYVSGGNGWIAGAFLDKTSAPFGSPAELLIAVNPRGLAAGKHVATIEISAPGAKNTPRKLVVVLTVGSGS